MREYCAGYLGLIFAMGLAMASCADAPARPVPAVIEPEPATLPELLKEIEAAYRRGNYQRGLALVQKAFELQQNDVSAMDRIGSIYYVLGRYGEAVSIWSRALPLEQDLQKRRALENSIAVTRRSLGIAEDAPAAAAPAARPKTKPGEIARLYKQGVKYYTAGEYLQATTVFLRILELEPGNAEARKALERLRLGR